MNKERLLALADRLEQIRSDEFDMEKYCGSACCIAGHAIKMRGGDVICPFSEAAEYLGLKTISIAGELMEPDYSAAYFVDNKQAAKVVRYLVETGKVDWKRFIDPEAYVRKRQAIEAIRDERIREIFGEERI